jgi:hypothetical protein
MRFFGAPLFDPLSSMRGKIARPLSFVTCPKTVCFPLSHATGAKVMKNCELLVFGPLFAMESMPGASCFLKLGGNSSSNSVP